MFLFKQGIEEDLLILVLFSKAVKVQSIGNWPVPLEVVSILIGFTSVLSARWRVTEGVNVLRSLFDGGLGVSVETKWIGGGGFWEIAIMGRESPCWLKIGDGCTDCKHTFHKSLNSAQTTEIQIVIKRLKI